MLVKGVTKQVEVPHEPGEFFVFRRLSWRQLEMAGEIQSEKVLKQMAGMGKNVLDSIRAAADPNAQVESVKYDRAAVLLSGIAKWSYKEPVTAENIDLLDEETADWAFREILNLNKPRTEEEQKNG